MKILGIDQSYSSTGLVLIEGNNVIDFRKVTSDNSKEIYDRNWEIVSQIRDFIKATKPNKVGMEGLAFGMTGNATRDLAGLQHTIYVISRFIDNVGIDIVTPLSVKKFATGSGKAKKEDMIAALPPDVASLFTKAGFKKTTGLADLTDAYFIAKVIQASHK